MGNMWRAACSAPLLTSSSTLLSFLSLNAGGGGGAEGGRTMAVGWLLSLSIAALSPSKFWSLLKLTAVKGEWEGKSGGGKVSL